MRAMYVWAEKDCRHKWEEFDMSFKEFSSAHNIPAKDQTGDKSKEVPAPDQAPTKPEKTPAKAVPTSKP